ncbi:MAG: YncE family protein, partial [Ilumatobacteraceae bacterium]
LSFESASGFTLSVDRLDASGACVDNKLFLFTDDDPCGGPVTATIPVGNEPWGVAFDGTNIYVSNAADDTVSKLLPQ